MISCQSGYYPTVKNGTAPSKPGGDYWNIVYTKCWAGTITDDAECSPKGCDVTNLMPSIPNMESLGTCEGLSLSGNKGWLADSASCSPVCTQGYVLARSATCSRGYLEKAVCAAPGTTVPSLVVNPCDASASPVNGTAGTCTANLASGSECTISCNEGYWPSQATSCSNGDLSAGTCDAVMSGQFTLNIPFNVFSVERIGTLHKNAFIKATAEITNLQEHQISVTQTSAGTAADSTAFDFECLGAITEILHAMRVLTLSNGATNFANFKIHYEYAAAIVGVDIAGITLSVTITQAVTRTRWARPSSPSGPSGPTPTPPAPPPDGTSIITQDISITTVTLAQYTGDVKRVRLV